MKIELQTKDTMSNIMEFVTSINKTDNLTALVKPKRTEDGYFVIQVKSLSK